MGLNPDQVRELLRNATCKCGTQAVTFDVTGNPACVRCSLLLLVPPPAMVLPDDSRLPLPEPEVPPVPRLPGQRKRRMDSEEAKGRGMGTEALVRAAAAWMRAHGVALLHKVPTEVVVHREKGLNKRTGQPITRIVGAHFASPASVDFLGTLRGGRAVALEVKSTVAPDWSLHDMPEHQQGFAATWHGLGGLAFVVVHFTRTGQLYRVPWGAMAELRSLRPAKGQGAQYRVSVDLAQVPNVVNLLGDL